MHECKLLAPSPQLMIQWWGTRPSPTSPSGKLPSPASDSTHLGHRTDQTEVSLLPHCLRKIVLPSPMCLSGLTARHREALAWLRLKQALWEEWYRDISRGLDWDTAHPSRIWEEKLPVPIVVLHAGVGRGVKQACNCALKQGLSQVRGPLSQTFPEAKVLHLNSSMW